LNASSRLCALKLKLPFFALRKRVDEDQGFGAGLVNSFS